MKQTIALKYIDLWAQVVAILIPLGIALALTDPWYIFIAYFSVGSVQVLSALVNGLCYPYRWNSSRKLYNWMLVMIFGTGIVLLLLFKFFGGLFIYYLLTMLLIGVFMAFWYFILSCEELGELRNQQNEILEN